MRTSTGQFVVACQKSEDTGERRLYTVARYDDQAVDGVVGDGGEEQSEVFFNLHHNGEELMKTD